MAGFVTRLWWGGDPDAVNTFSNLSRRDVHVVQKTWALIYCNAAKNGTEIFKRLFRAYPETKHFFVMIRDLSEDDLDRCNQFKAHVINLMSALNLAIANLNQPEVAAVLMNKLGESHAKKKIQVQHFLGLKVVILELFGELLKLDEAARGSWCKAMDFIYKHIFKTLQR